MYNFHYSYLYLLTKTQIRFSNLNKAQIHSIDVVLSVLVHCNEFFKIKYNFLEIFFYSKFYTTPLVLLHMKLPYTLELNQPKL